MKDAEIIFAVEESPGGGYEARAVGHPIFTEAATPDELRAMVRDAVKCHFAVEDIPTEIKLRFVASDSSENHDLAVIGSSFRIKCELSANEDLRIEGEIEGSVTMPTRTLTIGPHGCVRAIVTARNVIIAGKVNADIRASHRIELRKSAQVTGNLLAARISIEEGAYFRGAVDMKVPGNNPEADSAARIQDEVITV